RERHAAGGAEVAVHFDVGGRAGCGLAKRHARAGRWTHEGRVPRAIRDRKRRTTRHCHAGWRGRRAPLRPIRGSDARLQLSEAAPVYTTATSWGGGLASRRAAATALARRRAASSARPVGRLEKQRRSSRSPAWSV